MSRVDSFLMFSPVGEVSSEKYSSSRIIAAKSHESGR
jgi:hypothetical protein